MTSNWWIVTPLACMGILGLYLIGYKTLLEHSEGTIHTKETAVSNRIHEMSLLKRTMLKSGLFGLFITILLGILSFLGLFRLYDSLGFLIGFSGLLSAVFITNELFLQIKPRVLTAFDTSEKEGRQYLQECTTFIVGLLLTLATFFISTTAWLLHVFYNENIADASMKAVFYLGHSFWNEAIQYLPSFQNIIVRDVPQSTFFLFIGSVFAWQCLLIFHPKSSDTSFFTPISELFTSIIGLGCGSLILGTDLLERHIDYPKICMVLPLLLLGGVTGFFSFSRILRHLGKPVMSTMALLAIGLMILFKTIPLMAGVSLISGILIGTYLVKLSQRLRLLPVSAILCVVFWISGGFLAEGPAWFHVSLFGIGFLLPTLFVSAGYFEQYLYRTQPQNTSIPYSFLGISSLSTLVVLISFMTFFKQSLADLAGLTIIRVGTHAFTTVYAFINPSQFVHDLSTCDLSTLANFFHLTVFNPVLIFGMICGFVMYKSHLSFLNWVLPSVLCLTLGLPAITGYLVTHVVLLFSDPQLDSQVSPMRLKIGFSVCILFISIWIKYGIHF